MAVGYVLIGWIVGIVTALTAGLALDFSWLAAFGLFVGTSVLTAFVTILLVAWRTGCFSNEEGDGASSPALVATG